MCFFRQRTGTPHIAFAQRPPRHLHVVADLSNGLLLLLIQLALRQSLQLAVGGVQPLLHVLPLPHGFRRRNARCDLFGRFACSALTNHNLLRSS